MSYASRARNIAGLSARLRRAPSFVASGLTLLGVLAGASAAEARVDVCYSGGPYLPNFQLNDDASLDGTSLVVTESIGTQRGSLSYNTPLDTSSDIHIKMRVKISEHQNTGADGMAFVMHNDPAGVAAIGTAGGGIGYEGITKSVIVEFDTWSNGAGDRNNANHVAINRDGSANSAAGSPTTFGFLNLSSIGIELENSPNGVYLWIDYSGTTDLLRVFIATTDSKPGAPQLSATVDVASIVGPQMYLTFTGSTGGASSKHEILELYATDEGVDPEEACCDENDDCAASALGPICDPVKKSCGPCSLEDTTGCDPGLEGCDLSRGTNECASACDGDEGSPNPNACASGFFPSCSESSATFGSCVTCDGDDGADGAAHPCPSGAPVCLRTGFCGVCSANSDCQTGPNHTGPICNSTTLRCEPCDNHGECGGGNYCNEGLCLPLEEPGEPMPDGTSCPEDSAAVCDSGECNAITQTCSSPNGDGCDGDDQCTSDVCGGDDACGCIDDLECEGTQFCAFDTRACSTKLAAGAPIPNDGLHDGTCSAGNATAVCQSGLCNPITDTCADANGAVCTVAAQCVTATCTSGRCVPETNGCFLDGDCDSNEYCDRPNLTCVTKLAAGTAIPNDGLHDGDCTVSNAEAVCQSNLCNETTNTCASANGAACGATNECVTGTCTSGHCVPAANGCFLDSDCDTNEFCDRQNLTCAGTLAAGTAIPNDGLHDGDCTVSNAEAVCQSNLCNETTNTCADANSAACTLANQCVTNTCTSGHCVPATEGCFVDGDCDSNEYCDRPNLTCVGKLAAGTAIPNDGLHDGDCTVSNAEAVCQSNLCNETTNTCAGANGDACGATNQCVTGTCTSGHCVPAANGCFLDSDCDTNEFCDRQNLTCVNKLAAGTAIPNDGLHDGDCTVSNAQAVCQSNLCNEATNTCADANIAACTLANQCVTNTCTSGHCVPATEGCFVDGDCDSNEYCDRPNLTCVNKLAAGTAIPNDGLHDGECSVSNAEAVCQSNLCNETTNTCADANSAACTLASQCVTNTCTSGHCVPATEGCFVDGDCDSNEYCDRPNLTCVSKLAAGTAIPNDGLHDGDCTVSNAEAVCQSNLCNETTNTCADANAAACTLANQCVTNTCTSGHCVPATEGCFVDGDCDSNEYCDRPNLTCVNKLAAGTAIPNDGLHDGECTVSNAEAVCQSNLCNETTNTCADANSAACTLASQCATNTCTSGHCVPATEGCFIDGDCDSNEYCDRPNLTCVTKLAAGTAIPNDGLHDGECSVSNAEAVCQSNLCNETTNTCADANSAACTLASQCATNTCTSGHCVPATEGCFVDGDCDSNEFCDRPNLTCVSKLAAGTAIPNDGLHDGECSVSSAEAVCQSNLCNETTNTCADANVAACTLASQCVTNTCTSGHCVPATEGCFVDGDCDSNEYCDRPNLTCVSKLAAGTAIPNDGLHDGECSVSNAEAVCQSNLCNETTNTCADANSAACTLASQCATNTCTSGHCVPATEGCFVDGDCDSNEFCDRPNLTCVTKLAAGTAIPNDGLHDGDCTVSNAEAVCQSNLCNETTNTCADANSAACTLANQCVTNTCTSGHCVPATEGCFIDGDCDSNEFCDRASLTCAPQLAPGAPIPSDGLHDGSCSDESAPAVCLSGFCNEQTDTCASVNSAVCTLDAQCVTNTCTSGHCVPASGGCYVDDDCQTGDYCDRARLVCQTKLPAGTAIPSDGLHDGSCNVGNAAAVCQSALCNETTDTCATSQAEECTVAAQCVTNTCTSGHCVPASSGCYLDGDCQEGAYCDRSALTCVAKLAAGSVIPSDGLHDGACSSESAAAVCATGACNEQTDTCADSDGAACTLGSECVTGTCTSGHCVPALSGCYVDANCGSGQYCNRTALTCQTRLAAGAPIPNDGLHDGSCTEQNAAAVCQTGMCNAAAGTCGSDEGAACTAAADCATNACAGAHCVPSSGGCWSDADCGTLAYCDRAELTCVLLAGAGTAIPNDGLHDGICTPEVAALVCSSGACNTSTNTCAEDNGEGCSTAGDCVSNVCGDNGICGIASGSTGCTTETADLCQTGICSETGRCLEPAACDVDGDCESNQYCDSETSVCRNKVPSGSDLPDGTACEPDTAARTCVSGLCNESAGTCAEDLAEECVVDADCASNACVDSMCEEPSSAEPPAVMSATLTGGGGCSLPASPPERVSTTGWVLVALGLGMGLRRRRQRAA